MRQTALAAAAGVFLVLAPPAAATFPGGNGKIAFTSQRDGISQIYVMDPSGANQTRLTTPEGASQPAWSPDGTRIAYVTGGAIHTMDATGGTDETVVAGSQPSWSGDGERLVYVCGAQLCTVGAHGGTVTALNITAQQPSWSPDGTKIAFERNFAIETANPDGQGAVPWTFPTSDERDEDPDWAPDGSLTFHRYADTQFLVVDADVFRVGSPGATPVPLTTADGDNLDGVASPDGTRLAWVHFDKIAGQQIAVDGAILTSGPYDMQPSWQAKPDRDGDGLLDRWETDGYDDDGDGTVDVDLPAMGADPDRKDVFVELDHMTGRRLDRVAVQAAVDAFGRAPVANLNGVSGIALHVDNGADSEMDPATHETWGARSRQDVIPTSTDLAPPAGTPFDWAQTVDPIKAVNFDTPRKRVFHYAISALDTPASAGGRARRQAAGDIAGSDFVLTMDPSAFGLTPEALRIQGGTFMHELGHNLGLQHGGGDGTARKPNYLSVMNYVFQTSWLRRDSTFSLDYSRFDMALDEAALDERRGFGVTSGPAGFWTEFGCPTGEPRQVVIGSEALDWDCNDVISPVSVPADLNLSGATEDMPGHLDWPALRFDAGEIGAGARAQLATTPGGDEPPFSEVLAVGDRITNAVAPLPPASPTGPTATPTATPAATSLAAVTALRIRPSRFRATRRRGPSLGSPRRARVTYTLTRPAAVRFTVTRLRPGKRPRKIGSFRHVGANGRNVIGFTGRIKRRPLKPGRYRLTASAAGGARRARFTIRR